MAPDLLVSYAGVMGGAERTLLEFAATLGEPVLHCPEGPLAAAARGRGIAVLAGAPLPLEARGSPAQRLFAARALAAHGARTRDLVRALEPELVVLCGMRSALAALGPGRLAAAAVVDHHDLLPGGWIGAAVRRVVGRAALVVVPSQTVAEDLGQVEVPVQIVPPGVEPTHFDPALAPAVPPLVLWLGAIVPWKRPELAVAAVARARQLAPELAGVRLRLAGAPLEAAGETLRAELLAAASAAGLAVEIGPAADVPATLAAASCLLHTAECEPFGIALVEALAAGRPVVAPDGGGPREIVDSTCGVLYPPGDEAAAGAALAGVLADPGRAAALGAAGRARAEAHFDIRATRRRFAAAVQPLRRARVRASAAAGAGLTVVTVSYNSAPELRRLLASLARHLPGAEVIVVDSASADDSVAIARNAGAQVLALAENLGFGAACNRGVAAAAAPVCALLNPDVGLLDDSLERLAAAAAGRGQAARPARRSPRTDRARTPSTRFPAPRPSSRVHSCPTRGCRSCRWRPGGRGNPARSAGRSPPRSSAPPPSCAGSGPSTSGSSSTARISTWRCAPGGRASRRGSTRGRGWFTRVRTRWPVRSAASRWSCSPAPAGRWWPSSWDRRRSGATPAPPPCAT